MDLWQFTKEWGLFTEGFYEDGLITDGVMYDASGMEYYSGSFENGLRIETPEHRQAMIDEYSQTDRNYYDIHKNYMTEIEKNLGEIIWFNAEVVESSISESTVAKGENLNVILGLGEEQDPDDITRVVYFMAAGDTPHQPGDRFTAYARLADISHTNEPGDDSINYVVQILVFDEV